MTLRAMPWQQTPTAIVGRSDLIADVMRDLGVHGRVLVGPAGVGKSRILGAVVTAASAQQIPTLHLVATQSLATVPLGVFVTLLPETLPDDRSTRGEILAFAAAAVHRRIALEGIRAIAVDDAHLLDAPSAGLLHQLARAGIAVYAAVRANEPENDAVRALWTGGLSDRVDIRPLDQPATSALLEHLLYGPVDRRLARDIYRRTGGNPLFVVEMARHAVDRDAIVQRGGLWVLARQLPISPRIRSIVADRLGGLPAAVRIAAELVALAEPLDAGVVSAIVAPGVLDDAIAAGVLVSDPRGGMLRLSHPLEAEVLLELLGDHRLRLRSRQLLTALDGVERSTVRTDGPQSDSRRVLMARLRVLLGDELDGDELVDLAELVLPSNLTLCETFVRAALRQRTSAAARVRIAAMLAHQQRLSAAERVLDWVAREELGVAERVLVVASRAFLFAMPENRPDRALDLLERSIDEFGDVPILLAERATALWRLGRVKAARTAALPVLQDPDSPPAAAAHAGLTVGATLMHAGAVEGYGATRRELVPLLRRAIRELPEGEESATLSDHYLTLIVQDDLDAARQQGERGYLAAMQRSNDGVRAQHAFLLGWNAILRGSIDDGLARIAESLAARGIWCGTTRPWVRALSVEASVQAGDLEGALAMLERLDQAPRAPIYDPDAALAHAAVLVAAGDRDSAARTALEAGNLAHALGQDVSARIAWYAATRYGDVDAAARLLAHAPVHSPAQLARRLHASALISSDAGGIEQAATALAHSQFHWHAVDAQAQAVVLHRQTGANYRAASAAAKLSEMLAEHPSLHSPLVAALPQHTELTPREREIAGFAASGLTDRAIAERLDISVRTVQTHLARVYNKLGARSRRELLAWLPVARPMRSG